MTVTIPPYTSVTNHISIHRGRTNIVLQDRVEGESDVLDLAGRSGNAHAAHGNVSTVVLGSSTMTHVKPTRLLVREPMTNVKAFTKENVEGAAPWGSYWWKLDRSYLVPTTISTLTQTGEALLQVLDISFRRHVDRKLNVLLYVGEIYKYIPKSGSSKFWGENGTYHSTFKFSKKFYESRLKDWFTKLSAKSKYAVDIIDMRTHPAMNKDHPNRMNSTHRETLKDVHFLLINDNGAERGLAKVVQQGLETSISKPYAFQKIPLAEYKRILALCSEPRKSNPRKSNPRKPKSRNYRRQLTQANDGIWTAPWQSGRRRRIVDGI